MERGTRSGIASLFVDEAAAVGESVALSGGALRHAQVRRLSDGEVVRLLTGDGRVATGSVVESGKRGVRVRVNEVVDEPRPSPLELIVPMADRERMLWAAEKSVELRVTAWRPVRYARSRSVAGRGEGARFAEKVRARMIAALEQSGGSWLPDLHGETDLPDVIQSVAGVASRVVLDASGAPLGTNVGNGAVALAVGPEGGFEHAELDAFLAAGWVAASLGPSTLRFETAVATSAGIVRALQHSMRSG